MFLEIRMKQIVCSVALSVAAACGYGQQARGVDAIIEDFYHHPERILVTAHRAAHIQHPENSMAAIRQAIRDGIDIVELDIRETKDSVLVIMHDSKIDRTTTGKGPVQNYTYKELQQFFLLKDGKPTTEKIPTFEEVLIAAKGKVMIDIDFKADMGRASRGTQSLIAKHKMEKQVLFFVYDLNDVAGLRAFNAQVPIMPRAHDPKEIDQVIAMGGFPVVHIDDSYYSDTLMARVRKAGLRVWINALDEFDSLERKQPGAGFAGRLQARQANVIQTDLPEQLLAYLRAKGLHR